MSKKTKFEKIKSKSSEVDKGEWKGGDPLKIVPSGTVKTMSPIKPENQSEQIQTKIEPTDNGLKLDLACGQSHVGHDDPKKTPECKQCQGFEGADIADVKGIKFPKTNLFNFPWPWEDASVDEIHCSHFIEHIPMEYVGGIHQRVPDSPVHLGKDLFFAFFDELYRILKPGGKATIIWPALRSNRAFQDPTHRRFIPAETFLYLNSEWRKVNRLDHYNVVCDFIGQTGHTMPQDESLRTPEAQAHRYNHFWNTIIDFQAQMVKK